MYNMKIGVVSGCLNKDCADAIREAGKLGIDGIQIDAAKGRYDVFSMNEEKYTEIKKLLNDNGLVVSAVSADIGVGLANPDENPAQIERIKKVLDMAKKLDCNIVVSHIGYIPKDTTEERYSIMLDACTKIAEYAESIGSYMAIETGPELSENLKAFLDLIPHKGIGVNLDPANLMMVHKENSVQAVKNLKDYIVHTHAKDGVQYRYIPPERIYGNTSGEVRVWTDPANAELPLGEGDVNFPEYLKALNEIGYNGFLTIEREVGENPVKDITMAIDFLKNIIK